MAGWGAHQASAAVPLGQLYTGRGCFRRGVLGLSGS